MRKGTEGAGPLLTDFLVFPFAQILPQRGFDDEIVQRRTSLATIASPKRRTQPLQCGTKIASKVDP